MNLFSGSEDAQRCGGNSGSMWCFWITHQRTVRFQIMWLLVCSLIAALSGENYATQAQVMSSKALRASNARSNGEFGRYGDLKSHLGHLEMSKRVSSELKCFLFHSF